MVAHSAHSPHTAHSLRRFDQSVVRRIGVDMRPLYGMGVPILGVIALLIALALYPKAWLVAAIVIVEVAGLALVVTGLMEMMVDNADDDPQQLLS
ncbi:MAG: hypothetical protein ABSH51_19175 [Solirubrobacteraceae bacterium]|jgi:VIT1/CCC1 family predicted Fe2+/Mn2+ transporter